MNFMVAKAEKRKLQEDKETTFYSNGILVEASKIEQAKKRRLAIVGEPFFQEPSEFLIQLTAVDFIAD
jgi:hypothetical protein